MLVLKEKGKKGAKWEAVYIVDAHHHIGKSPTVKNLSPSAPDGTYSFCREILFGNQWKNGLFKEMQQDPDRFKFELPSDFSEATKPSPPAEDIINGYVKYKGELKGGLENSFAVDQIAAFPMDDTYRDKEVAYYSDKGLQTPTYALSNSRLSQVVNRFPNSLRFIGFGRVFPEDKEAPTEVRRMVTELGIRGLKLHPKSEPFDLEGEGLLELMRTCGELNIPIIFHTSYLADIRKIYNSLNTVLKERVKKGSRKKPADLLAELMQYRVILGHCGWHASPDLWNYLTHPNIMGEISGIRSTGVGRFFQAMEKGFDANYVLDTIVPDIMGSKNKRARLFKIYKPFTEVKWYQKVGYGSDFPFMDHNQSIDVFAAIFSNEFPGGMEEIRSVLGMNTLKFLNRRMSIPMKKDVKPTNYSFSRAVNHTNFAMELMSNLQSGFDSVVYNPSLDEEGAIDWIGYDILDNKGEMVSLGLGPTKPIPLLPKKNQKGIKTLTINSKEIRPPKAKKPKKLTRKDIAGLVDLNEGDIRDFEL